MNNVKWFGCLSRHVRSGCYGFILNLMMLGISYIDYDISVDSMIYLVVLNIGMTAIFYSLLFKEIKLYQHFMKIKK